MFLPSLLFFFEFDKIWFISKILTWYFFVCLFDFFCCCYFKLRIFRKIGGLVKWDLYLSHLYFLNFICFSLHVLIPSSCRRAGVAGRGGGQGLCPEWGARMAVTAPCFFLRPGSHAPASMGLGSVLRQRDQEGAQTEPN